MSSDFFEIDRLVEDLAKIYATACTAAWFRIERKKNPTREEFRSKVVEFMKHFEHTLSVFPTTPMAEELRRHALGALETEINRVKSGENKEVEKRYKYFVEYS